MAIARIIKKLQKVPPMKVNSQMASKSDSVDLDDLAGGDSKCGCIKSLMQAQQSIRMHHWLTTSHAEHGALGEAYGGLDALIDTFVETMIGAKSRSVLSGIDSLQLTVEGDCMKVIDELESLLKNKIKQDIGEETDLLNIRDEMLALVRKTKYLLTLD